MTNLFDGEKYRTMLEHFRPNDLKALLEAFGQNNTGQRTKLRKLALELLSSRPNDPNYEAYLSKISEIYHLLPGIRTDFLDNNMLHSSRPQDRGIYRNSTGANTIPRNTVTKNHIQYASGSYRPVRPRFIGPSSRPSQRPSNSTGANTIPRNTVTNNHIQYASSSYQPMRPRFIGPSSRPSQRPLDLQNMYAMKQSISERVFNASTGGNNNAFIPSLQVKANYKFKKLPFYDVIEDIIKLTLLDGSDKCTLSNFVKGTKEYTFVHTLTIEQVNLIAMNRDISFGKTDYEYQYQIRICQLENGSCDEVTDDLPIGLHIRVGNNECKLPPNVTDSQLRKKSTRAAEPINIAQYLKLCPFLTNNITINWIPNGKKYALATYIVKQLSADTLMKKLLDKNLRSSEETKNYIIKKFTNVDPDLTAISSCTFSLICPLSKVRMNVPAKSIHCDHIQCFDAGTFILLNEKKPKWMCPMCNKSCLCDEIQIENYFFEIITSFTHRDDVNVIEVLADGSWIIPEENKEAKNMNIDNKEKSTDFIDLDDIVN